MSEACLSEIKGAMTVYTEARALISTYQLDLVAEEISYRLSQAKKLKRVQEALIDLPLYGRTFIGPLFALTSLGSSTDELRAAIIKKLEENLAFLSGSQDALNQSLTVLFDAWEAYVGQEFDDAAEKARQSENLARKSVHNCLVGIAREYIRRGQSRISAGRKIFADLKDARKKLDEATAEFGKYENEYTGSWTTETKNRLEAAIKTAKDAAVDAQYSIDDAKLPFVVTLLGFALGTIGGIWTLYTIIKFLRLA